MVQKIKEIKNRIRYKVWHTLEEKNIALFPKPVYHRIPNFIGADVAAQRLTSLELFKTAQIVKINPDSPQKFVRYLALIHNKIVIMPTPRIKHGFILLDPSKIPRNKFGEASTISGAYKYGVFVDPLSLPKIDLIVIGSVAVNTRGARLGKGEGYAELEYAILRTLCKINEDTYVITTVHDMQVVDDDIPVEEHDVGVDIIVTPTRVIKIEPRPRKSKGIIWNILPDKKISEIPVLRRIKEFVENEKAIIQW